MYRAKFYALPLFRTIRGDFPAHAATAIARLIRLTNCGSGRLGPRDLKVLGRSAGNSLAIYLYMQGLRFRFTSMQFFEAVPYIPMDLSGLDGLHERRRNGW